ncbi:MAG: HD domain-containing protein [Bacteriovoracaceae bacterium]|nr:HD domain-containing protein [Bacteriovoracaceae bacterium]
MEIRDPVHGSIAILEAEVPLLEHPYFQRLRNIKQLGLSEYAFPGASHTRYLHSIGVMFLAGKIFDLIFNKHPEYKQNKDLLKLKETLKLAALLHDIGHAPLSHATEWAMPQVSTLQLPSSYLKGDLKRKATHEDYTLKFILDSDLAQAFHKLEEEMGVSKEAVADLILGTTNQPSYFEIGNINFFPFLNRLISSEMDCDRMDYLLRDSYFCGVSYGQYDLPWLCDNLDFCIEGTNAYLAIHERAVATFDDFLLSRYHMFLMIYFHYRAVCLEQMLLKYFSSCSEYTLPSSMQDYQKHDDYYLMQVLRQSENMWAKRIVSNNIPLKIFESFGNDQEHCQKELQTYLDSMHIPYLLSSSQNRLSKYYAQPNLYPMKVVREVLGQKNIRGIEDASDLFQKFSSVHKIVRIHTDFDDLLTQQKEAIRKILKT